MFVSLDVILVLASIVVTSFHLLIRSAFPELLGRFLVPEMGS